MRPVVLLIPFLIAACEQREAPPAILPAPSTAKPANPPAGSEAHPHVQVPIGGDNFAQPRLTFRITRVYEKQKPIDSAPYHADGGAWTFFDAATDEAVPAAFTVGVSVRPIGGSSPFSFGDCVMAAADRDAGARFVAQFAGHFHADAPPAAAPRPLGPLKFGVAMLGRDRARLGRAPSRAASARVTCATAKVGLIEVYDDNRRPAPARPPPTASVRGLPILGGLHHRYGVGPDGARVPG